MSEPIIQLSGIGKMYRLYNCPGDKILDALSLSKILFWRNNCYREFWALRNLDLEIPRGQRIGIIGRNGAGKSTLLKVICGNVSPTEGTRRVAGNIQALMELGTGFHPEFTGRQNIRASLSYQGLSPDVIRGKEEEIIEFAELDEFIDQPIRTYSAGMYARLAFSAATSIEPDILVIDEILGAGDAYFAGKCVERMEKLTVQSGTTVLFVSHDLHSVQRLCPRTLWIDRGQLRRDGETLEVIKEYSSLMRKEDEIRLKARDMRVLKKQAITLDRDEDVYQKMLFHLVPPNGQPVAGRSRVYSICLQALPACGQESAAAIDVGSPMDNSADYQNYLMDTPGFMDWGPPRQDERGSYREYGDFGGRYGHAPFEMALPKAVTASAKSLRLEIEHQCAEPVAVEYFDGKQYIRLGELKGGAGSTTMFDFALASNTDQDQPGQRAAASQDASSVAPPASAPEQKPAETIDQVLPQPAELPLQPQALKESDQYGEGGAKIVAVQIFDHQGVEARVFEAGQPMRVAMRFEAAQVLDNPVFVFCIYLADGRCATQWWASAEQMGSRRVTGRGTVEFSVNPLLLGCGQYVASAGIFRRLRSDGAEAESYHVLDRCIHFEVLAYNQDIARGLCLQPFEVKLNHD